MDEDIDVRLPDNYDTVVKKIKVREAEEVNRVSRKTRNWKYTRTYKKTFNKKLNHKKWTVPRPTNK